MIPALLAAAPNIVDLILNKAGASKGVKDAAKKVAGALTENDLDSDTLALLQQSDANQNATNQKEAGHRSLLVAGWRPFIGWVCGVALAWHFLLRPMAEFTLMSLGAEPVSWPEFDLGHLTTILFGMLGLGTLRTAEKAVGKA